MSNLIISLPNVLGEEDEWVNNHRHLLFWYLTGEVGGRCGTNGDIIRN
jgi:hypothetical protein